MSVTILHCVVMDITLLILYSDIMLELHSAPSEMKTTKRLLKSASLTVALLG